MILISRHQFTSKINITHLNYISRVNVSTAAVCLRSKASYLQKKPALTQSGMRQPLYAKPLGQRDRQNKPMNFFPVKSLDDILELSNVSDYFKIYTKNLSDQKSDGTKIIPKFLHWVKNNKRLLSELEEVRTEQGPTIVLNRLLKHYFNYLVDLKPESLTIKQALFIQQLKSIRQHFDFSTPQDWFIPARRMKRKLIVHVGPTNSGKTYRALERLKTSQSGVYCGPLRLLALEIWKKFNDQGIRCNLVTGEEKKIYEDGLPVPITSCTIEMADVSKPIDVAVIDEIQMIANHQRGFAWTRAVLGLPAKEIHLCGEATAVPLIKWMAETLFEEVEINNYERLSPLSVRKNPKPGVEGIQPGDCVVAFSRKNIFAFKKLIESKTNLKCAVVYGKLPPENRALQAELFNDKTSGYDVMVASDAVGMGLNLNIQRIIFSALTKFNGASVQRVSTSMVKQIAGRAGRFGTHYANGIATTFKEQDFQILDEEMKKTIPDLTVIGVQPDPSLVERAIYTFPKLSHDEVLIMLSAIAVTGPRYTFEFNYHQLQIAKLLQPLKLPIDILMTILFAPIKVKNEVDREFAFQFVKDHATKQRCLLSTHIERPKIDKISSYGDLDNFEEKHQIICLYIWLSYRFPHIYTEYDYAQELKKDIETILQKGLIQSSKFAK